MQKATQLRLMPKKKEKTYARREKQFSRSERRRRGSMWGDSEANPGSLQRKAIIRLQLSALMTHCLIFVGGDITYSFVTHIPVDRSAGEDDELQGALLHRCREKHRGKRASNLCSH